MSRISKQELLIAFGFTHDPFKKIHLKTVENIRIGKVVNMAIQSKAMISIIGERGIGKSAAVKSALTTVENIKIVYPYSNDINKLLISDIEQSLILDLSNEKPKRGKEIRARQLRRILGEASTRANVVLVVEEAHHLHGMTLRALKRIREMDWMGEAELLSVILVGQSDPMNKPGVSEVRLRSDSIHMRGLSQKETAAFANHTVGAVFEPEAIEAVCNLNDCHNYEDLKTLLYEGMERALFAGREKVTANDINQRTAVVTDSSNAHSTHPKSNKKADIKSKNPATMTKEKSLGSFLEQLDKDTAGQQQQVAVG